MISRNQPSSRQFLSLTVCNPKKGQGILGPCPFFVLYARLIRRSPWYEGNLTSEEKQVLRLYDLANTGVAQEKDFF